MSDEYDVVIIGAGAVAENVADRAVQGGLTAVLIESELVGGECSYWACMPSKALIRSGMAVRAAQRVDGAKQAVTSELDVAAVFARRTGFTHDWDDSSQVDWVRGAGIDLVRGHGRLAGEKRVVVTEPDGGERHLTARHAVVVSTGSDPLLSGHPGAGGLEPVDAAGRNERPHRPAQPSHHRGRRCRGGDGDSVRKLWHHSYGFCPEWSAPGAGGLRGRDGRGGAHLARCRRAPRWSHPRRAW